jgi:hypothetical protein
MKLTFCNTFLRTLTLLKTINSRHQCFRKICFNRLHGGRIPADCDIDIQYCKNFKSHRKFRFDYHVKQGLFQTNISKITLCMAKFVVDPK